MDERGPVEPLLALRVPAVAAAELEVQSFLRFVAWFHVERLGMDSSLGLSGCLCVPHSPGTPGGRAKRARGRGDVALPRRRRSSTGAREC